MYKLKFNLEGLEGNNDLRAFFGQRKMNFMTCVKQIQEECNSFDFDVSTATLSMMVFEAQDGLQLKVIGPTATWMLRQSMSLDTSEPNLILEETWNRFSSYLSRYGNKDQVLSQLSGTLKSMHLL